MRNGKLLFPKVQTDVKHRERDAHQAAHTLHPLHGTLMPFHALFQVRQSPWLAHPDQGVHLRLQCTQVTQNLRFEIRHFSSLPPTAVFAAAPGYPLAGWQMRDHHA